MTSPLLALEGVDKSYGGVPVIAGATFQQAPGEFLAIVGPSGCGKTTMLRCCAGLVRADAGRVLHLGQELAHPPPWLSIVFQDYNRSLFPWLSVRDNAAFGLRGLGRAERRARAERALESVGLGGAADLYPWQLSGGMQQRCAIARSIAVAPRLLLLDEPFASVDAQTRIDLQDVVMDLCASLRLSALLVTHDVDEAVLMADRVIVLSGRPTRVIEEIAVDVPRPRDQLTTKERPDFLRLRHRVYELVRGAARAKPGTEGGALR